MIASDDGELRLVYVTVSGPCAQVRQSWLLILNLKFKSIQKKYCNIGTQKKGCYVVLKQEFLLLNYIYNI